MMLIFFYSLSFSVFKRPLKLITATITCFHLSISCATVSPSCIQISFLFCLSAFVLICLIVFFHRVSILGSNSSTLEISIRNQQTQFFYISVLLLFRTICVTFLILYYLFFYIFLFHIFNFCF